MTALRSLRQRFARRSSPARSSTPRVEGLEDRLLLFATSGNAWAYPQRITYSFMPDGTSIGGAPSNMYAALAARGITASQYELQIEKAMSVWQGVANINLARVSDNGAPMGSDGNQQDDPNFGDIRIGGYNTGVSGQLAFCLLPPPANGGTHAGDIFFNSTIYWTATGQTFDLETVAIHEIGHALGMDHSSLSTADMYATYNYQKQSLTSDDIAGIQSIYGARSTALPANNSFANATDLTSSLDANGQTTLNLVDNVFNRDVKYFYVTAPASTSGTLTVTMQSTNLSSMCPQLVVYASNHSTILANVTAPNSYGATDVATITGATAGTGYYIRCQAAQNDVGGIGAFGLQVNFSSTPMAPVAPPNTVVTWQPNGGGGGASEMAPTPGSETAATVLGNATRRAGRTGAQPATDLDIITIGGQAFAGDSLAASPRLQRLMEHRANVLQHRAEVRQELAQAREHARELHGLKAHAKVVGYWNAKGHAHA